MSMPLLLDAGIAAKEFIAFAIGPHRDVVRMSVADYKRLARPLIGSITVRQTILV